MHVRSQFIPRGVDSVRIGDLRPNYNYTCVIQETLPEGAPDYNGILSKPVNFTSDYAGLSFLYRHHSSVTNFCVHSLQ